MMSVSAGWWAGKVSHSAQISACENKVDWGNEKGNMFRIQIILGNSDCEYKAVCNAQGFEQD